MRALRLLFAVLALVLAFPAPSAAHPVPAAAPAPLSYTVQAGDTLGGIARRFGTTVDALARANGITDPNRIVAGRTLTIPARHAAAVAAPAVRTYTVRAGDTLGAIAGRHGTTVARLVQVNGLRDPNLIREGMVLRIEAAGPGYVCPVQGPSRYDDDFGAPRGSGRSHQGIDLVAPRGTPVVANEAGILERSSNARGGLAYYLTTESGDVFYGAHLDSYVARDGRVKLGQAIGTVGDSGNAVGGVTHLHFERMPGGDEPVNPYGYLTKVCVRD